MLEKQRRDLATLKFHGATEAKKKKKHKNMGMYSIEQ